MLHWPHLQELEEVLRRRQADLEALEPAVRRIVGEVRAGGDRALRRLTRELEGRELDRLRIPPAEMERALRELDPEVREALRLAAERLERFQRRKLPPSGFLLAAEGEVMGELVRPLERVGIYVPGGKASYPSTALMCAVPARVAGVREVVVTTPRPTPAVLAACALCGVSAVFPLGGAQAIAALAYGTESVPRVDKIVGPGGAWVTCAKRLVFGQVDVDMLAGPSEVVVICDESVRPELVAEDLLSQAEHDELALPLCVAIGEGVGREVRERLEERLPGASPVARACMERHGVVAVVPGLAEALELADRLAPEHLELMVSDPWGALSRIRHCGAAFLGPWSAEAFGDYLAGPNHVLPTGGGARSFSPLGVEAFLKRTSFLSLSREAAHRLAPWASRLARLEGLEHHARAAELRGPASSGGAPTTIPPASGGPTPPAGG